MTDLPRRRQFLVLAICCLSLLIVSMDNTDRQRRPAEHPPRPGRLAVRAAVDDRRLHAGARQPADAVRLDRRPAGPPARPSRPAWSPSSSGSLLCSVAPGLGWLIAARRCRRSAARCSTRWRCRSSPTSSPTTATGPGRSGSGAVSSGCRSPSARWSAACSTESVGWRSIFWINVPIGLAAIGWRRGTSPSRGRPRARRVDPVGQLLVIVTLAALTSGDHRGPAARLGLAGDPRAVRARRGGAGRAAGRTSRAGATRCCSWRSSAARRSPGRPSSRSRRSAPSAGSCSSTRSTCRTCAATRRPARRPVHPAARGVARLRAAVRPVRRRPRRPRPAGRWPAPA